MKIIAMFGLAAALLSGGFVSTASAQLRLGTVDMKRVFESYYKTRDADQKVREQQTTVKKEMEDRLAAYRKAVAEVQKLEEEAKRPELSAAARAVKQKEFTEKVGGLNLKQQEDSQRRAALEKELQDLTMRLRGEIVEDITRIVRERAKADSYDLVIDRTGPSLNNVPLVLYSKESYDFTDDVVAALKSKGTAPVVKTTEAVRTTEPVRPAATPKKPK